MIVAMAGCGSNHAADSTERNNTAKNISYFSEESIIPTPDSCVDGITYKSKDDSDGVIKYLYDVNGSEEEVNEKYHQYQKLLSQIDNVSLKTQDNIVIVSDSDGNMISALGGGIDDGSGFLMVSFLNRSESEKGTKAEFTNKYGSPTTICAHKGCTRHIASSGDTNCCEKHSNKCLSCGKYIDEDAMYCMDCILKAYEEAE